MIAVVPTTFAHLKQLQQMEGLFFTGIDDDKHAKNILENSTAFSMIEDGVVLGSGGILPQWPGVGQWWLMVGSGARRRPRALLRVCNDILERTRVKGRFHRFQVYVDPAEPRHIRFVEALGFTFEGRLVKHTVDGKDHLLYARTY